MNAYHEPASAGNATGLPFYAGLPLLDWREAANSNNPHAPYPSGLTAGGLTAGGLTAGGRIVFERTRRPVATCNAIARLAGIGQEAFPE